MRRAPGRESKLGRDPNRTQLDAIVLSAVRGRVLGKVRQYEQLGIATVLEFAKLGFLRPETLAQPARRDLGRRGIVTRALRLAD